MVEEGLGTRQKISNEALIKAIADVRIRTAEATSSHRVEGRSRARPYRYPDRYPRSIGLDPDKVQCNNCRHWDEKELFCLILRGKTEPNYLCADFGRIGL